MPPNTPPPAPFPHYVAEEQQSSLLRHGAILAFGLEISFLFFAVSLLLFSGFPAWQSTLNSLAINFIALVIEALPFMLLGTLAGGLIEVFVPQTLLERLLADRYRTAPFWGAGLGLLLPVCECAIVPVIRRLLRKGVPFPAAIAFLLGGPIVNLVVASSTAVAYRYDWLFVGSRVACGYLVAVTVALIMGEIFQGRAALRSAATANTPPASCGCCGHDHAAPPEKISAKLAAALQHATDDLFEVGRYLIIGAFIAAFMRATISIAVFQQLMNSPGLAIFLMMCLAVLLNLCSEADAFIAASFQGVLPGSGQLAFMVLGPMLDVKLVLMYLTVFRKRAIITLSFLTFALVFLLMLVMEYFVLGGI